MKVNIKAAAGAILTAAIAIGSWSFSGQAVAGGKKSASSNYSPYKGAKAIDGDTYRYGGQRYRIQQYNAPEIGQPGSRTATRQLQNKINSGTYQWKPVARDVYGRTIVRERFSE